MLYRAFGEQRYSSGTTPTDYRYTGQLEQATIGLYYYGARWYDPALGRFTQPDTIVPLESQGVQAWDRYAYVNNSPVNYTDPTGHDVGCPGQDASECASSTIVVIACGQNEVCGASTELMQLYYADAVKKGFQIYFYNNGDYAERQRNKLDMALNISEKITNNLENYFLLEGHSAGADALIEANYQTGYAENIIGNILLEPSMDITLEDGSISSLQQKADKIPANKIALISGKDSKDVLTINGVNSKNFPDLDHTALATNLRVFLWISDTFSWFGGYQ